MKRSLLITALALACSSQAAPPMNPYPSHSSAMALSKDGKTLYVVNPDADSVSVIDPIGGTLTQEILLAPAHPAVDGSGNYAPSVMPRALALSPDGTTLYVTGERSGKLHVIDLASGNQSAITVGSEPIGVVVSDDGNRVYVACSQDNTVVRVDALSVTVTGTAQTPTEPWALALSPDGAMVYATHFLAALDTAALTTVDATSMQVVRSSPLPILPPRGDKRLAHGQPRALYDVVSRPGTTDLWIPHMLLGTDTAQPDLDFESTQFPAVAVMSAGGGYQQTMSVNAQDVPGVNGAFGDVVSGMHALAFTHDGRWALAVDSFSEDVLVIDAERHVESSLVRPLSGHQPEGIVISPDDTRAYVSERNTSDVVVLTLDASSGTLVGAVSGAPIPTLTADPMPQELRLGQHLFNSANSDEYPITKNHWMACANCHPETRSDEVTWRFLEGPRDTPTNSGGVLGTGFLLRTAERTRVEDYWRTINPEQGGTFDPNNPAHITLLTAIAEYVNHGIPFAVPPTTDPALVAQGAAVFQSIGCAGCHSGPRFTDSGGGNPTLDLDGPVLLHDVGTCAAGVFPDVANTDVLGHPRDACAYDTPSLNGLASTPPYMHDGSSPTIVDAVHRMYLALPKPPSLGPGDEAALVEYLRSL